MLHLSVATSLPNTVWSTRLTMRLRLSNVPTVPTTPLSIRSQWMKNSVLQVQRTNSSESGHLTSVSSWWRLSMRAPFAKSRSARITWESYVELCMEAWASLISQTSATVLWSVLTITRSCRWISMCPNATSSPSPATTPSGCGTYKTTIKLSNFHHQSTSPSASLLTPHFQSSHAVSSQEPCAYSTSRSFCSLTSLLSSISPSARSATRPTVTFLSLVARMVVSPFIMHADNTCPPRWCTLNLLQSLCTSLSHQLLDVPTPRSSSTLSPITTSYL